jgi:hypothetical protein
MAAGHASAPGPGLSQPRLPSNPWWAAQASARAARLRQLQRPGMPCRQISAITVDQASTLTAGACAKEWREG